MVVFLKRQNINRKLLEITDSITKLNDQQKYYESNVIKEDKEF